MAFVFVPNADGNFDEGMRQTNPDTGVEYIFTDGAWRPLGPKIEDQFDELDQRYLPLSGGTLTDNLFFDRGTEGVNMLIHPNANDTSSSIYALNSGNIRFRTSRTENLVTGSNTHIVIGRTDTLDPQTNIYHLAYPQEGNWAANKAYVDEQVGNIQLDGDYVPLTGGDMTGDLNMMNARIDTFNAAGDLTMEITPSGFVKTRDMVRVVRTDGGAAYEARVGDSANDTRVKIDSDGYWRFDGIGELKSDVRLKDNGRYIVRSTGNTNVGYFMATDNNTCQLGGYSGKSLKIKNVATPVDPNDGVNKSYVDNQQGAAPPSVERPPGLMFNYESGSGTVSSGKFKWYTDGGRKLKISATSLDLPWGKNSPIGDISFSESHLFHIYATTTTYGVTEWKVKTTGSFKRMDWHTNDILLHVAYSLQNDDFSTTAAYYITIAGLF